MEKNLIALAIVAVPLFVALHAYVYRTRQVNKAVDELNRVPRVRKVERLDNWSSKIIYFITCIFI